MAGWNLLLIFLMISWRQDLVKSATTFTGRYSNSSLPHSNSSSTSTVIKPCLCRNACFSDDTCTAYAVATLPNGKFSCTMANTSFEESELVPKLDELPNWTTFKSRPCTGEFTEVEGVGCIFISTEKKSVDNVKTACPAGSGLLSPFSDAAYRRYTTYMNNEYNFTRPVTFFWIGVNKVNEKWTWRDGHTIPSTKGSSVWHYTDPNTDGATCALSCYITGQAAFSGGVGDERCTQYEARYICSIP